MEGIVIIAILYYLFKAFTKKAKIAADSRSAPAAQSRPTQPKRVAPVKQTVQTNQPRRRQQETMRPTEQPARQGTDGNLYQIMKPTVFREHLMEKYTGSMGMGSQEGVASQEGSPSIEGRGSVSEGMAQDMLRVDEAYSIGKPDANAATVLPLSFGGNALLQAVVMSEVLAKPRKWSE